MPSKKKQTVKLARRKKPTTATSKRLLTKKVTYPIPVEIVKHKDSRVNIPTEELRGFVADAENEPKTLLYPRDTSLDPQLVWKGKDEQDAKPLEVPVVPVYIQEKIHPQALVEDIRKQARKETPQDTPDLFGDFNGVPFQEMVDFYHHDQHWSNRMILGDSLLVMSSLAEKERLRGKVQMIYLDPPYGIKFGSNWQVSTRKRDVRDGKAEDATRQPEQVKAFRDTWRLGINSYLAYLRDRLVVCLDLLTESGSVFVQIGEENVHLVRSIIDEVMGSENFVVSIILKKTPSHEGKLMEAINDYILWYAKNKKSVKFRTLFDKWDVSNLEDTKFRKVQLPDGTERRLTEEEIDDTSLLPNGSRFFRDDVALTSEGESSGGQIAFSFHGKAFPPGEGRHWRSGDDTAKLETLGRAGRLQSGMTRLFFKLFHDDFPLSERLNMWAGPDRCATQGLRRSNKS